MNLRSITKWTTILVLIVSFVLVGTYFIVRASHYPNFSLVTAPIFCVPIYLICIFPLLVSAIVLVFVKHPISLISLLLSTLLFGVGVIFAFCSAWGSYSCMSGIEFFGVVFASLYWKIPAWIVCATVEFKSRRKQSVDSEKPVEEQKPE